MKLATNVLTGPETVEHSCERGLRVEDPGLWTGTADREWDDRVCGDSVVPGAWDHAQLDALQPDGWVNIQFSLDETIISPNGQENPENTV